MRLALAAFAIVLTSVPACRSTPPRESQVLLVIRTDAPLPSAIGGGPALFDRMRVEVFSAGADAPCQGCVESFAVNRAEIDAGRTSFGVVVSPGTAGRRVRLTLFPSRGLAPRPSSSIVKTVALPIVSEGELFTGHVDLRVADVGAPQGSLDAPHALDVGEGTALAVWPEAQRRECTAAPGANEACIPGGAFFMGDPALDVVATPDEGGRVEHLVVLDPFFFDRREVTVAELRAANVAEVDALGKRYDPADTLGPDSICTYTDQPGPNDTLPVTCVSHHVAEQYCAKQGKRLPTEAEFAFVAGGLESRPYVWGSDPPACGDAVFGASGPCPGARPLAAGSGKRDRFTVGAAEIVDVAGNVSEWVVDLWNRDDDPCFRASILRNPRCETPSERDGKAWIVRGGAFASGAATTRAAVRSRLEYDRGETRAVNDSIGFRCARGGPI